MGAAAGMVGVVGKTRETGRVAYLRLGALVGVAFNTKMLAGWIPGPAFALAIVVGVRGPLKAVWRQWFLRQALLGVITLAVSASWGLVVDFWPGSDRPFIGGDGPSIADMRFAATLEFLRSIDYEFPAWAEEYMTRIEETLGDAYTEPASDVRGYVDNVKSQSASVL